MKELIKIAKDRLTDIMCAEILWFKCHRRFVSDKLKELGFEVIHIFNENKTQEHTFKENKVKCEK